MIDKNPAVQIPRMCPKCTQSYMMDALHYHHICAQGLRCPTCGFVILDSDTEELVQMRVAHTRSKK